MHAPVAGKVSSLSGNKGEIDGDFRDAEVYFEIHCSLGKYSYRISTVTTDLKHRTLPAGAKVHCIKDAIKETARLVKDWFPMAGFLDAGPFIKADEEPLDP